MNNRYFIEISFLGTAYHGWQIQKNAHTVQAELHKALKTVFRREIETSGCGRTDTGVHAKNFYAHFDLDPTLTGLQIRDCIFKLNSLLPHDIAVHNIITVKNESSARFDADSRTYQYFIHHHKNPFLAGLSLYRRTRPDVKKMNQASRLLLTYNDFSCFSKSRTQVKTNICRIYEAEWFYTKTERIADQQLVFQIRADRFLRNMVRAIVGTLLETGDGLLDLAGFKKILESKNRSLAGVSVPACGLYLSEVLYPKELFQLQS